MIDKNSLQLDGSPQRYLPHSSRLAWNNVGIHYNHPTWTDDQGLDIEQITDKALLFQLGAYNPSDNICRLILCKNG